MTDAPSNSTATVVVGCKLPHGFKIEHGDRSFTLKGNNASRIVGGYGLTEGVPKDLIEAWLKANAKLTFVKNGLIFIQTNRSNAEARAKEGRNEKTGFEAVDPLAVAKGAPDVDPAVRAQIAKQRAENPDRNRQQVE